MNKASTGHGKPGKSHGPGKGKSAGKVAKSGKSVGKGDKVFETEGPPHHLNPLTMRHGEADREWHLMSRNGRSLYYCRINTHVCEVCLEIGGPTAVRTWDDMQRYLDGTLVEFQEANREAM